MLKVKTSSGNSRANLKNKFRRGTTYKLKNWKTKKSMDGMSRCSKEYERKCLKLG